jgi:mono/diheme cytochrome c family protein
VRAPVLDSVGYPLHLPRDWLTGREEESPMTQAAASPLRARLTPQPIARALVAFVALTAATGALAADFRQGQTLAKRWCAACHIVAPDQTHGQDNVPPFATIARIPGFDVAAIARFLMNPHPKMPDMQLTRDEADDLAAYIVRQGR